MSELSIDALSWDDKQRVMQLHPTLTIESMSTEYRYRIGQAKARRLVAGVKPMEYRRGRI